MEARILEGDTAVAEDNNGYRAIMHKDHYRVIEMDSGRVLDLGATDADLSDYELKSVEVHESGGGIEVAVIHYQDNHFGSKTKDFIYLVGVAGLSCYPGSYEVYTDPDLYDEDKEVVLSAYLDD